MTPSSETRNLMVRRLLDIQLSRDVCGYRLCKRKIVDAQIIPTFSDHGQCVLMESRVANQLRSSRVFGLLNRSRLFGGLYKCRIHLLNPYSLLYTVYVCYSHGTRPILQHLSFLIQFASSLTPPLLHY